MTFKNGLKAGAIGAVIAAILTLAGVIPAIGWLILLCSCLLLIPLLSVGAGVLAGYFGSQTNPMQTAGDAAPAGAVAGVLTALGGGLVQTIVYAVQMAMGGTAQALAALPPEQLRQLRDAGLDPAIVGGVGGLAVTVGCCCIVGPLVAAGLGAIGGALTPSIFKRNP
jgi:hypothetical protein